MKCPDCKIEMDLIDTMTEPHGDGLIGCEEYWKCPKCKLEIDSEDVL